MKFSTNKTGLERISLSGKPLISRECLEPKQPKEYSEDTKIRLEINRVIMKMIEDGKNDVMIEIHLTNLYPNYKEYILKMIAHRFSKKNADKIKNKDEGKDRNE